MAWRVWGSALIWTAEAGSGRVQRQPRERGKRAESRKRENSCFVVQTEDATIAHSSRIASTFRCNTFRYRIALIARIACLATASTRHFMSLLSLMHDVDRVMSCSRSPLLEEEHAVRTGRFATKASVEATDRRERTAARKADFMVTWMVCFEKWSGRIGACTAQSIRMCRHESSCAKKREKTVKTSQAFRKTPRSRQHRQKVGNPKEARGRGCRRRSTVTQAPYAVWGATLLTWYLRRVSLLRSVKALWRDPLA